MDRVQGELLVKAEQPIQHNLTVGELLGKIEPMIPRDASRRLYILLANYLDVPMPDSTDDAIRRR